ncbi:hypothetical protein GEO60473_26960 [Geobacter sp. 60473]|nr:hypothetical protein GEO60473_26960 [Geobacter sp. 60473]
MGRVQVLDYDKGHAAPLRHVPQELFQRFQPAGGGAYADNGEGGLDLTASFVLEPWRVLSQRALMGIVFSWDVV